jgi:hypothetical protein
MFVGEARSEAPEKGFNWEGLFIARKLKTGLERLTRYKNSSLLDAFVNNGRKKLYNIGPWV